MRLANVNGRLNVVVDGLYIDLATASDGELPSDPQEAYLQWERLVAWVGDHDLTGRGRPLDGELGAPVPRPRQVFALALNYPAHADESGFKAKAPLEVFAKFSSCITGPNADVELTSDSVDHEVELVFAMSQDARDVQEEDAWSYVAGLMVGQDISDRSRVTPDVFLPGRLFHQLGLDKSHPSFGPTGPVLVTIDEFDDPSDLAIECWVNGTRRQSARSSQLIYSVPTLIALISARVPMLAGDLCFTGTPAGVGFAEVPPRFLQPGDTVRSSIEGIGEIENTMKPRTLS